ncbi:MAG: PAS domain S-box protein, partial [Armatimonadetes bacterium]|nr:PAS domain S-box protein [Armatimonadota bacterium]
NVTDLVPEEYKAEALNYIASLKKGELIESLETKRETKDGKILDVWMVVTKLVDKDGKLIGAATTERDITERKQAEEDLKKYREHLEELVKERTVKLEKSQQSLALLLADVNESRAELDISNIKLATSNKELEAFSYSVSHDLRAPLRAIDGFTRILLQDYVDKLDDEGKRLGTVIRKNSQKMGKLIDDLLAFSRLGRASMNFSRIDMKNMAKAIYHEATNPDERKRINFSTADLPDANGDPNMFRQVWLNLISNAIKFSSNRPQTVISVTCREEEDKLNYCISDNGAGFDMKYKDKLFGVFQRLHNERDFPGTGVGLALVQRIIHRHNGKVWAEGEVDKGASFYFSLPKKKAEMKYVK